ncbi:MAG TPA: alpha/beta hydrolase [Sphingomonas sp.]|nr:alpha/beta hydrolase [Sphingomonas sp.]
MPDRAALLGHSMGARIALEIWRHAPQRISRLALADTGVHPVRSGERESRYALRDLGRAEGAEALVGEWLPPMVGRSHQADPDLMARLHRMACDGGPEAYERQIEALLHRPDAEPVLATIDCPTLVVVGGDDLWSPVAHHEDIAARIPGARLRVVENAGHMAPAEEPDQFNAFVREWMTWRKISTRDN